MTHASVSDIAIRPARREDAPRIAELILLGAANQTLTREQVAAEVRDEIYLSAFDAVDASPDNRLFVAEREGSVIGTYQLTLIPGLAYRGKRRAKLESVHVAPEWRGQGIGRVMVSSAIGQAREAGAGLVELTSNKSRTDAHRFYRGLGFQQSHEGFKLDL